MLLGDDIYVQAKCILKSGYSKLKNYQCPSPGAAWQAKTETRPAPDSQAERPSNQSYVKLNRSFAAAARSIPATESASSSSSLPRSAIAEVTYFLGEFDLVEVTHIFKNILDRFHTVTPIERFLLQLQ